MNKKEVHRALRHTFINSRARNDKVIKEGGNLSYPLSDLP